MIFPTTPCHLPLIPPSCPPQTRAWLSRPTNDFTAVLNTPSVHAEFQKRNIKISKGANHDVRQRSRCYVLGYLQAFP